MEDCKVSSDFSTEVEFSLEIPAKNKLPRICLSTNVHEIRDSNDGEGNCSSTEAEFKTNCHSKPQYGSGVIGKVDQKEVDHLIESPACSQDTASNVSPMSCSSTTSNREPGLLTHENQISTTIPKNCENMMDEKSVIVKQLSQPAINMLHKEYHKKIELTASEMQKLKTNPVKSTDSDSQYPVPIVQLQAKPRTSQSNGPLSRLLKSPVIASNVYVSKHPVPEQLLRNNAVLQSNLPASAATMDRISQRILSPFLASMTSTSNVTSLPKPQQIPMKSNLSSLTQCTTSAPLQYISPWLLAQTQKNMSIASSDRPAASLPCANSVVPDTTVKTPISKASQHAKNTTETKNVSRKGVRYQYLPEQLALLEEMYKSNHYPSKADRMRLEALTNLSQERCKIWFQNRRSRERRKQRKVGSSSPQNSISAYHYAWNPTSNSVLRPMIKSQGSILAPYQAVMPPILSTDSNQTKRLIAPERPAAKFPKDGGETLKSIRPSLPGIVPRVQSPATFTSGNMHHQLEQVLATPNKFLQTPLIPNSMAPAALVSGKTDPYPKTIQTTSWSSWHPYASMPAIADQSTGSHCVVTRTLPTPAESAALPSCPPVDHATQAGLQYQMYPGYYYQQQPPPTYELFTGVKDPGYIIPPFPGQPTGGHFGYPYCSTPHYENTNRTNYRRDAQNFQNQISTPQEGQNLPTYLPTSLQKLSASNDAQAKTSCMYERQEFEPISSPGSWSTHSNQTCLIDGQPTENVQQYQNMTQGIQKYDDYQSDHSLVLDVVGSRSTTPCTSSEADQSILQHNDSSPVTFTPLTAVQPEQQYSTTTDYSQEYPNTGHALVDMGDCPKAFVSRSDWYTPQDICHSDMVACQPDKMNHEPPPLPVGVIPLPLPSSQRQLLQQSAEHQIALFSGITENSQEPVESSVSSNPEERSMNDEELDDGMTSNDENDDSNTSESFELSS